jgi:hypothetical protein
LGWLLLQKPEQAAQSAKRIEELEQEVDQIEGQLARDVAGLGQARRALATSLETVQGAIPERAALIEYVRYRHYLGKGRFELSNNNYFPSASLSSDSFALPRQEVPELNDCRR